MPTSRTRTRQRPGLRRWVPLLALIPVLAALAGCSTGSDGSASSRIRVAFGTLLESRADPFTVQPQPAPGSCHARGAGSLTLPDPGCTPGAIDPSVTPTDIQATICRSGYTETVRPPETITETEKRTSLLAYGDSGPTADYEYDHLIPLELGGARNDPRNLWPEPGASPNPKDAVEGDLRVAVCSGSLSLRTAQVEIARDWRRARTPG